MEDRIFEKHEKEFLLDEIARLGLSQSQVEHLHIRYMDEVIGAALADDVITEHEMEDLRKLGNLLDLDESTIANRIDTASQGTKQSYVGAVDADLQGSKVCFTGAILSTLEGEVITRTLAHTLALNAGLEPVNSVTKKLDILVVADSHTQSGKARKAAKYGVRVITERAFWPLIGVSVS